MKAECNGLLNCASGNHSNSSTPRMEEKDDDTSKQTSSAYESPILASNNSSTGDCSTPAIVVLASSTSSRLAISTRKQKFWKSLRRFHFRSQRRDSASSVERQSPLDGPIDKSVKYNGLARSDPNLPDCYPSTSHITPKSNWFGTKTPKKSIIRTDSSNKNHLNCNYRVEFASSDQIYPVLTQSKFSPVSNHLESEDMFPTPPTSAQTIQRQEKHSDLRKSSMEIQRLQQEHASGLSSNEGEPPEVAYLLQVQLLEGHDLVIRDTLGSSDPYVKFGYKEKLVFKSSTIFKNLNPSWNEHFNHLIDDLSIPLQIDVYDYDRFALDDFMGGATLDLSQFLSNQLTEVKVYLTEQNNEEYMGFLLIKICVTQMSSEERLEFVRKSATRSTSSESTGGKKVIQKASHVWSSVVNIVLVEGKNLLPTDIHSNAPLPDPYVRFKLGAEKFKSKPATKTLEPKWLEQFDLHIYEEQTLDIRVLDKRKDIFMGRCSIPLSNLDREITHQNWYELEDGAGKIFLLISISGTLSSDTVCDISSAEANPIDRQAIYERYRLLNSFENLRDIGHMTVKVYKAQGLASADLGGKSDPFCVLELVNARLQTHTEYKTLSPEWNKIFTFNVKDIHSVLEITIFDEDQNNKSEFLGKVAIPLMKIRNGEKRWYALKDKKLHRRAKGQILLEFDVKWNPIRASIRTINPKEQKYMGHDPKFKRQTFTRNVMRVKNFAMSAVEVGAFVQSCWSWESPIRSFIAFIAFLLITYFFELYMLPLILLLLFIRAYVYRLVTEGLRPKDAADEYFESDDDDDDGMDDKNQQQKRTREEKKSLKERLQAVQDTLATVQNVLDYIASLMERVKNTFNFTQPFLSWFAVAVLSIGTIVLYFLPLRFLILAWGINKFTKKLRSPHAIPNNELLDFLSRVPSDDEIRKAGKLPAVKPIARSIDKGRAIVEYQANRTHETRRYGEFRPDPVDNITTANNPQQPKKKRLS